MKRVILFLALVMFSFNSYAKNLEAEVLMLTDEQSQKVAELKENLKKEIGPIWDEIQEKQNAILEIEKKYFEEFWKLLTDEQKAKYESLNKKN
ncbi:MAG: hypothetical protein IKW39_06090 [Alphaproteobacteria bacterium]|nr:hypothetical protein [Alphaproteobacteria bacterium]